MLPSSVEIHEVGPREGFQFEGIGDPSRISTTSKLRLINALVQTGVAHIQVTSFVHPTHVPQMADAEQIAAGLQPAPGVEYTAVYLNERGLQRALAAPNLTVGGKVTLTASETFAQRNQRRSVAQDLEMQRLMAESYKRAGIAVTSGSVMAAFGCNYEGQVPSERVLNLIDGLVDVAAEVGDTMKTVVLADTMGWGNPEQVASLIRQAADQFPGIRLGLHLHDTRGMGIANAYAALQEGLDLFDSSVGGLGGCPFAGFAGAAGNVATEELVFLCDQLGIETGIDLEELVRCTAIAQEIVGHPLPSKLAVRV